MKAQPTTKGNGTPSAQPDDCVSPSGITNHGSRARQGVLAAADEGFSSRSTLHAPRSTTSIAVVGLGYVGLPLSLQFARSGVNVVGLDIDAAKVDSLNAGRSYIKHVSSEIIAELVEEKKFRCSTDFSLIREVNAVIICVPTPLNKNREPDISYILETGKAIAPHLRNAGFQSAVSPISNRPTASISRSTQHASRFASPDLRSPLGEPLDTRHSLSKAGEGIANSALRTPNSELKKLVVLESTTYPGTTDEDLRAVLEAGSGLKAGVDFHLAFSPEREDPGNPDSKVASIPKVVGGYTSACLERAIELYSNAIKTLVPVSSCRAAEATKLLENTFRGVNIALVNELKVVYSAMGIDIWEVIAAAKTKPFGFMPFYPGPGLGGHCIPIDPFYLTWKAREYGQNTRFIELAGEINSAMPEYVIHRVAGALNAHRKPLNGSKVLVLGLAYKPNVDDERESPSYVLMDLLKKSGAQVAYHDPYVPVIKPTREHSHWAGTKSMAWERATVAAFDLVLLATNHSRVNYQDLADWSPCIVDTRNAMTAVKTKPGQVWKA